MTNLSISQIHPLLQFISLTSFEHPPYARLNTALQVDCGSSHMIVNEDGGIPRL